MKNNEIWKTIPEFEGTHQISNFGRLRTVKQDGSFYMRSTKASKNRYINVSLSFKSIRKTVKIHRLVAQVFLPNPESRPQVNHKNFDKTDNHIDNLEWVTEKENIQHALKVKPEMVAGMIKYNREIRPKKIIQKDKNGNIIKVWENIIEIIKETSYNKQNIYKCCQGKYKYAYGYKWCYL